MNWMDDPVELKWSQQEKIVVRAPIAAVTANNGLSNGATFTVSATVDIRVQDGFVDVTIRGWRR